LVCVSTEYAGKDFPLTRPELVIGRVEDNDIVIEHRSVSRNHAKIVFDGRIHKIIDLESANGILVNGEEYAITDLRKGDLIELGHVKFRFIPAGEAFQPTDEEARAMVDAGVAPPARSNDVTAPPQRPVAPPPLQKGLPEARPRAEEGSTAALEIPGMVASEDPSNAATVTDTPLSAFAPELFQPKVADSGPSRGDIIERPAGRNGASAPVGASLPRDAASETTPLRSSPRPVASHAHTTRTATARAPSDLEDLSRGDGKGKVIAAAALVVLVFAVLIGGAIVLRGPNVNYDQVLREYYDRGDYPGVQKFFLEHSRQFSDLPKALELRDSAVQKQTRSEVTPPTQPPEAAPAKPPEDQGEPPPGEEPAEEEETTAAKGAKPAARPAAAKAHPSDAAAAQKKSGSSQQAARAAQYEIEGRKALLAGDLGKAERFLKLCLNAVETYAPCHRQLGVLYASKEDTRAAIQHYKRYIELDPNAVDAERVRQLIQDATRK
jgi:pSer/pThr/pTyr-binding forkhead associated (FHA) protein